MLTFEMSIVLLFLGMCFAYRATLVECDKCARANRYVAAAMLLSGNGFLVHHVLVKVADDWFMMAVGYILLVCAYLVPRTIRDDLGVLTGWIAALAGGCGIIAVYLSCNII